MRRFVVLVGVVLLLTGCGGPTEEIVAPGIQEFGADLDVCPDDPCGDAGLEPIIIIPKTPPDQYQFTTGHIGMNYEEWLSTPAGKILPELEHNEAVGLGIDVGD